MMIAGEVASVDTPTNGPTRAGGLRGYLKNSRDLSTSVLFVIPLFIVYQVGVLATGGLRNGVDFVTNILFSLFGGSLVAYTIFNLVVLAGFGVALGVLSRKGHLSPRIFPFVLLESAVYAVLLGSVVIALIQSLGLGGLLATANPHPLNFLDKLVMSAGAGLYEEIVFRLFLMGGMFLLLTRVVALPRFASAALALVLSSVIFSAAHHISEPFTMSAFTFRIFAGMMFAFIYQTRGFAVAAYTHAFYDVWVMVFRS